MIRFCVHEFLIFCMFRFGLATIFSVCGGCTQRGKETPLHVYGQNIGGALSLKGILFDAPFMSSYGNTCRAIELHYN